MQSDPADRNTKGLLVVPPIGHSRQPSSVSPSTSVTLTPLDGSVHGSSASTALLINNSGTPEPSASHRRTCSSGPSRLSQQLVSATSSPSPSHPLQHSESPRLQSASDPLDTPAQQTEHHQPQPADVAATAALADDPNPDPPRLTTLRSRWTELKRIWRRCNRIQLSMSFEPVECGLLLLWYIMHLITTPMFIFWLFNQARGDPDHSMMFGFSQHDHIFAPGPPPPSPTPPPLGGPQPPNSPNPIQSSCLSNHMNLLLSLTILTALDLPRLPLLAFVYTRRSWRRSTPLKVFWVVNALLWLALFAISATWWLSDLACLSTPLTAQANTSLVLMIVTSSLDIVCFIVWLRSFYKHYKEYMHRRQERAHAAHAHGAMGIRLVERGFSEYQLDTLPQIVFDSYLIKQLTISSIRTTPRSAMIESELDAEVDSDHEHLPEPSSHRLFHRRSNADIDDRTPSSAATLTCDLTLLDSGTGPRTTSSGHPRTGLFQNQRPEEIPMKHTSSQSTTDSRFHCGTETCPDHIPAERSTSLQSQFDLRVPPPAARRESRHDILGEPSTPSAGDPRTQKLRLDSAGITARAESGHRLDHLGSDFHCAICLTDYQINEILHELPCCHRFHAECIRYWLSENGAHHNTCPLCKCVLVWG
ncbi:uncharacterized protein BJ171DRAFT_111563 [Polychytrium aggregatum]|uniref:uncharacterized protein n=1 Tax=Polychytrium aggregatum TaxID=110093 RepID=UPI0022FF08B1|nr:uncharacterized protein BJ171DRAFT_111563 [Polychytrium aggregatum]KAI9209230.1 hypothetical protein BJ171DRAFT_111563 [Polychytrium aggregatum]